MKEYYYDRVPRVDSDIKKLDEATKREINFDERHASSSVQADRNGDPYRQVSYKGKTYWEPLQPFSRGGW